MIFVTVPSHMRLAYVLDEVFTHHRPPGPHPERPERLLAVRDALFKVGLEQRARRLGPREAREDELSRVHDPAYLAELERTVPGQQGWLDGDTYYSPDSWRASLAAAAAGRRPDLRGAGRRLRPRPRPRPTARPPRRPATARWASACSTTSRSPPRPRVRGGARGSRSSTGTCTTATAPRTSFWDRPDVLYSCRRTSSRYYPGTGAPDEIGGGRGRGSTVNVGLPRGLRRRGLRARCSTDVFAARARRRFRPDLMLVSAGFDAHRARSARRACASPSAGLRARWRRGCAPSADAVCRWPRGRACSRAATTWAGWPAA